MVDVVSPEKRSSMMAGIRNKNTKPEILIRKLLHAAGFRFRLHDSKLPGRPDIVLPKYKTAIFVNGCFWHGHENCHHFRLPKSKTQFWAEKISGNRRRDAARIAELGCANWRVFTIWECAIKGLPPSELELLKEKLCRLLLASDQFQAEISRIRAP